MNRHFIFNSLNSIQYYINKQDRLEANRYLTNFAKLIRKNLDSSVNGENMVSLFEELDRIKLYLSLEMMRFKDKFTFDLNVSPEVDLEAIKIPPMLMQPYIENSIWHGILPKDKPGKIDIKIFYSPALKEKVCVEIIDDGIGIDVSLAKKVNSGSTHISRGIEITSGRLNLLKKMTNQDLEIHGPNQIIHPNGQIIGTRVMLVLSTKPLVKTDHTDPNFSEKSFEF
jgi:sensor histidine kinase YesM